MPNLTSQMEAVCRRFEELSIRLNQPETAADPAQFRRLMQEYHEAQPVVDAYHALTTAQDHLAQAKALLEGDEPLDADFKAMVQQELSEKSQDVAELENNLKILLLPKDVNDEKSVIMEIRAGAGGEEAALFAHNLVRMYTMYVQSRGWEMELLNLNETELGGTKEAVFAVNGRGAYNRLKYESGVHRVQRVPETETQGRIHTSTATVAVMPQAEEVDFALDMKDLRIDTFRSSGAGGQHINKTGGVYAEQVRSGIAEVTLLTVQHHVFQCFGFFPLAHLFVGHIGDVFTDVVLHLAFCQPEIGEQSLVQVFFPTVRLALRLRAAGRSEEEQGNNI